MNLELTDTETAAVILLLKHAIAEDRYPLSERVQTWQGICERAPLMSGRSFVLSAAYHHLRR
jgi:hypothetical protein